jgi:hypothetical protein
LLRLQEAIAAAEDKASAACAAAEALEGEKVELAQRLGAAEAELKELNAAVTLNYKLRMILISTLCLIFCA